MYLKARVAENFARVDIIFERSLCYSHIDFFHFNINEHKGSTYNQYKISAKYNKPFQKKVDFNGFNIFNISDHLGFLTRPNFISLKLHVKFEIHGCSGFRE